RPPIATLFPYTTLFRSQSDWIRRRSGRDSALLDRAPLYLAAPDRGAAEHCLGEVRTAPGVEGQERLETVDHQVVGHRSCLHASRSEEHTSELQSRENLV